MKGSAGERMLEGLAKWKANELLLKACLFPFLCAGAVTSAMYGLGDMSGLNLVVFLGVAGFLQLLAVGLWVLISKSMERKMPSLVSSRKLVRLGMVMAYVFGLFLGWLSNRL